MNRATDKSFSLSSITFQVQEQSHLQLSVLKGIHYPPPMTRHCLCYEQDTPRTEYSTQNIQSISVHTSVFLLVLCPFVT